MYILELLPIATPTEGALGVQRVPYNIRLDYYALLPVHLRGGSYFYPASSCLQNDGVLLHHGAQAVRWYCSPICLSITIVVHEIAIVLLRKIPVGAHDASGALFIFLIVEGLVYGSGKELVMKAEHEYRWLSRVFFLFFYAL